MKVKERYGLSSIASAEFNLDQLKVGKQAFVEMLKKALAEPAE